MGWKLGRSRVFVESKNQYPSGFTATEASAYGY